MNIRGFAGLFLLAILLFSAGIFLNVSRVDASLEKPVFSRNSGFYDRPFLLEIYVRSGAEIHYTLDGSVPDKDSPLYTEPIYIYDKSPEENSFSGNIFTSVDYFSYSKRQGYELPRYSVDKCTVVRAAAFDETGRKSSVETGSFFVGFKDKEQYRGNGIISLVSDPEDLFGYERGIYVIGKLGTENFLRRIEKSEEARKFLEENPDTPVDGTVKIGNIGMDEAYIYNYSQEGPDWERPGDIAFFDSWGRRLLSGQVGIRIKGHNSRNFPQKSLSLFERNTYSKERFYFPFLDNKIKNGVILSGGGDDMYSLTREPFLSELFKKNGLAFGVQEFSSPVFLFLNGEFWGTYLLSEKQDKQYLRRHYGIDEDNALIVKNGFPESGSEERYRKYYGELVEFILNNDLSSSDSYHRFCELVDIESLMDYYSARIYVDDNSDWPKSNVSIWRAVNTTDRAYEDGRWRFLNFDNNIELQPEKTDHDTIDLLLSQGEEDYLDLIEDYGIISDKGGGLNELLRQQLHIERMLIYCLFKNSSFREAFTQRFKEIETEVYDPEAAERILSRIVDQNRQAVVAGYRRWYGERCGEADYNAEIDEIRFFLRNRRQYMDGFLDSALKKYGGQGQ